ncbi:MAG TPA: hypothetical protein VF266_14150 [Thermoanaerobaculia bacterium]
MTKQSLCVLVALVCALAAPGAFAACPAGPPALTSPGNGAQVPFGDVSLNWEPVAGASEYQVWLALESSPFGPHATVTGTQITIQVEPGRTVQWKIVATAPSCAVTISPIFTFNTACPTGKPVIQLPARGAQFRPGENVTFTWIPVPGATSYDVNVTDDFGQTHTAVAENIVTNTFTTTFREGDWGWHVRANFDGSCAPAYSEPSHFEVAAAGDGCPAMPGKPALIAPAANATNLVSPVTFSWTAVSGAVGYRVIVARDPGGNVQVAYTNDTKASVSLPAGTASWFVMVDFGEGCAPTISERRVYTVTQGATCNVAPPQLLAPANNSVPNAARVTFKWSAVANATAYELWVATGGDNDFALYGVTDARTTELERFVPNDVVDWYVVARLSGCPDVRSSTFRLGAATACPFAQVTLTAPANGANVTSPVTLAWNAVQGATEYRITIRSGDSSIVTRSTNTSISSRLPAGTFSWRVEALRGENCSSESAERIFTVGRAANCDATVAPALVSPAGSEAQPARVTSPVTLTWSAAANAIAYRVWVSRNGQPFEDVALTTATTKQLEIEEPGKYAWFVNAIFEGCDAKRSNVGWFELADTTGCSSTAPAVIAPAAGQRVSGRVAFQWGAVPGAEKYRVILIVDGKPLLLGTTTDTRLERLLEPGTYTYAIEALFAECRSTFSPRTTFVVERGQNCATDAPSIVSPSNGWTVTEAEVTFVWTPVSGALRYAVLAKSEDGAETLLGTTEETTLTHRVPAGEITWRVVAFFASCDAESSSRATFTHARPQGNCSERRPVILFPNDDRVVPSPVQLAWLGVPDAEEYRIWMQQGEERPSVAATTSRTFAEVNVPQGPWRWFVEARFPNCPSAFSAVAEFTAGVEAACGTPRRPEAQVIGRVLSGTNYNVRWTPLPRTSRYEVQESTSSDFANAQSFFTATPFLTLSHLVTGAPVRYLYRVRALSACDDTPGPFSDVVDVYVIDANTNSSTTELGGDADVVVQKIFVPGGTTPVQFTARADKPWLMVSPTSGTLPAEGITLTVTADPNVLKLGTNTGTVQLTYSSAARGGIGTNDGPAQTNFPMSVSLVTPVMPEGKGTPPPDALIFPAVGHAAGANDSLFESDVRLTNLSAQTMKYDLYFTPSGVDGTEFSNSTTIEVSPNETVALDDVVANVFGDGTAGSAIGMLEVRPVATSQSSDFFGSLVGSAARQLHTAASSRTYNFTPNGTYGQFIPAIPFAQFVGRGAILSLQQVAQSNQFRANFGFLEASGNPADLTVRVYDTANTLLTSFPLSLRPMEHRQINGLLQQNGITTLADGRVEVEVVNGDGKVSAYVSEVDNATNDPLMVSPVIKGETRANRWVVPGMASLRSGSAFWVSDLRVFNAGDTATPATLTFYPMGNPAGAIAREITLAPGEIEVLNNVLVNLFGLTTDAGGSIVITTPAETALTATARTYNQTSSGTYGQFIPGVTVAESISVDDRALQILQVEQSSRFRTNIGVNETSGKPVTIEVSLIMPDSFVTPVVTIPLAANEFRQIGLVDFALSEALYNGRVTVKVIAGEGRVTAYGSAIDAITQDPTYVPAQ